MKVSARNKILAFAFANAIIMCLWTLKWLHTPETHGDEQKYIAWTTALKKMLLGWDDKPPTDQISFIDVDGFQKGYQSDDFGRRSILTDRLLLGQTLKLLNQHKEHFDLIVLDVLLDERTPEDSILAKALLDLGPKVLTVSHFEPTDSSFTKPIFNVQHGCASYEAIQDKFVKTPLLVNDTIPSVSAKMFELLDGIKITHDSSIFYLSGNTPCLNMPIVDFRIREKDILFKQRQDQSSYDKFTLGEFSEVVKLVEASSKHDIASMLDRKIIMIGSFSGRDTHPTLVGELPGPLIILNNYLVLHNREHEIKWPWVLMILLFYWLLTLHAFGSAPFKAGRNWKLYLQQKSWGRFYLNYLNYGLFLSALSVASYFIFNIHLNVLYMTVYQSAIYVNWGKYESGEFDSWLAKIEKKIPILKLQSSHYRISAE